MVGCSASDDGLRRIDLPVALQSRVLLTSEPELDREHGAPVEVEFDGEIYEVRRRSRPPHHYQLWIDASDGTRERLFLSLSDETPIPLVAADQVRVLYRARWDTTAGVARRAVSIRDAAGELLVAFHDSDLLDDKAVPQGIEVHPDGRLVYTEAGRLVRLCYTVLQHRQLKLVAPEGSTAMQPGQHERVELGDRRWLVVAVDNAATLKADCPDYKPDRFSWFVVRLPPAEPEPEPAAAPSAGSQP